jgi:hypothetical protein
LTTRDATVQSGARLRRLRLRARLAIVSAKPQAAENAKPQAAKKSRGYQAKEAR